MASTLTSSSRTMSPGTSAGTARSTAAAAASPSTPPPRLSSILSVRSWRTIRPRPAPSAAQTANPRWRVTPRASNNPVTFTQAISSMSAVADASAARAGRYAPTISSNNGIVWTRIGAAAAEVRPLACPFDAPASAMRCRMARTSVVACAAETPGRSRPSTPAVGSSGRITYGVQTSSRGPGK